MAGDTVDILIVDDMPHKMLALEVVLSDLGQNLVKASSGKDALRLLLQQDFAVILLDVNMPGMDGFETAALIRKRKNSEFTPIIFVTAVGGTEMHQNLGYSLGAVDYIFSPIVPDVLRSKVAVFVELYKTSQQIKRLNSELKRRATELELTNAELQIQLAERIRMQDALRKTQEELESRVEERTRELSLANEELKRVNRVKSDFTSMVSHELRTPLTAIKEGIENVLDGIDGPVTQDQRETLGISKSNVDRLARLIQNVLDFSKLESGKMEMFFEKSNMNQLITEVSDLMSPVVQKKGIQLILELPKTAYEVVCDADKIKQLLINLIDNAIKFTAPEGKIWVRLGQSGQNTRIEVQDTGIGIAKNDLTKIFDMFAQVHSGAHKGGGVGVGLAICKLISAQHGGEIKVESEPDKGTQFTLTFPNNIKKTVQKNTGKVQLRAV
jgi:signal transduction histidine kinase